MKPVLPTVLTALTLGSFGQLPQLTWSAPMEVADGGTYGNINPSIALTSGDIPVVMWGKASGELYVSRFQGYDFTTPVRITPPGMAVFSSDWAAPNIAASGNNVYAAFKEKPEMTGNLYFVRSSDGGLTFSDTVLVSDPWSRFAAVTARSDGNPLVTYMEFDSGFIEPYHVLRYSIDGGNSFGPAIDASAIAPGEVCDCCQGLVLSAGTRDVVIYRNNDNYIRDMWVSKTESGGASFSEEDIDNSNWYNVSCPGSGPGAIMTSDSVIAAWMSAATGQSRVIVGTVALDNMQPGFNLMRDPLGGIPNQNNPSMAGSGDTVALFWEEIVNANRDVFMSYSLRGAAGLNDTAMTISDAVGSQLDIDAVYSGGVFHIVYMDNAAQRVWYLTASMPGITGVHPNPETQLLLTPNPTSAVVRVHDDVLRMTIIDAAGKELLRGKGSVMDLSSLPGGLYFVRLETRSGIVVTKLMVN
jgi:hypothetical protein